MASTIFAFVQDSSASSYNGLLHPSGDDETDLFHVVNLPYQASTPVS